MTLDYSWMSLEEDNCFLVYHIEEMCQGDACVDCEDDGQHAKAEWLDMSILLRNLAVAGALSYERGCRDRRIEELEMALADALYWLKPGLVDSRGDEAGRERTRLSGLLAQTKRDGEATI